MIVDMAKLARKLMALVVGTLLASCAHTRAPWKQVTCQDVSVRVCVSSDFADWQRSCIAAGMPIWADVCKPLTLTDTACDIRIWPVSSYSDRIPHSIYAHVLGVTSDIGGPDIWLVTDRLPSCATLAIVAAHEIGHALGAEHSMSGIMTPAIDAAWDEMSPKTQKEVQSWTRIR